MANFRVHFLKSTPHLIIHIPSFTFHQINLSFSKPVTILQIKDKIVVKFLKLYAALYFIAKSPIT